MGIHNNIKIIVAESNDMLIEGLELLLSKNNQYDIIDICRNGKELIDCKKLHLADLVLSDIEMPCLEGLEVAKQVHCKYPNLPLIALTMHSEKVFLDDILRAGFNVFVYKTEISKKLMHVINQVLNNPIS